MFSLAPALPSAIALALLTSAGCQSNAQQDLVARELRMQEDQIYAMEDYLSQYQQLVCKYRSENAALRRRLADDYYDGEEVPEPRTAPPARRDAPSLGEPPARANGLELPEVPPLEGGAAQDLDLEFRISGIARKKKLTVVAASHEEPVGEVASAGEAASAAGQSNIAQPTTPPATNESPEDVSPAISVTPAHQHAALHQVSLRGEVVPNDAGGGPRLMVDVNAIDPAGRSRPYDGELSLMLLALQPDGGEQSLARWDYAPHDAASSLDPEAGEHVMRFYLELQPDSPVTDATQIWVRLTPHEGDKLLAHAPIRLDQPGHFASRIEKPMATSIPARIASKTIEGDWTIARPGEPANLPATAENSSSGWRTSSEPIPPLVQVNASPEALSGPVQQAVYSEPAKQPPPPVYKPPTWSPERKPTIARSAAAGGGSERRSVASRPSWSATR